MSHKSKFWYCLEEKINPIITLVAGIVSIFGISLIFIEFKKEHARSIEEQANEVIIAAISIFNAASDTADYNEALDLFLVVKDLRPNNLTGYNLFLELAKQTNEIVRNNNDTIYKYDSLVEKYLQYADSLNYRQRNEAKELLKQLQILKNDEQ
jgi:hypothetical protein